MTAYDDPFPSGDVLQYVKEWTDKRGVARSMTFDYIEDEAVMDRLDAVVGVGNWSLTVEPISVAEGIVKVRLDVGGGVYEDFGYQNREGGEALKEAVSDGIRRVGRMVGIGRYLYRKHDSRPVATPQRPAVVPATVRPVGNPYAADVPAEPPGLFAVAPVDDEPSRDVCPVHGKAWRHNSRGAYCATKLADGSWCAEKPS